MLQQTEMGHTSLEATYFYGANVQKYIALLFLLSVLETYKFSF